MRATWQKELIAHLDKHKRYPADRSQKSAEIQIRFTLDRVGRVLSTSIEKGSGDTAFDEAALAMVRRSDPVPAPPPLIADEGLSFTLPVIFRIKGKAEASPPQLDRIMLWSGLDRDPAQFREFGDAGLAAEAAIA